MQAAHPLGDADEVIRSYSRLIHHVAKRFKWALSPSLDYSDLVSEGKVGLLKAYNSFDPERGFKFATYASRMVQWTIQQHLRQREQIMRVSDRLYFLAGSILRQGMKEERPADVARKLSCSEAEAAEALEYLNTYVESMDRPAPGTDDGKMSVQCTIPVMDDHSGIETQEFLETLTKQERLLTELRIAGMQHSVIAKELRLSFLQINGMLENIREKYRLYTEGDGMTAKLTKEKYLELHGQGKTDKAIYSSLRIEKSTFYSLKRSWGLTAGVKTKKATPGPVNEEPVSPAHPFVPASPSDPWPNRAEFQHQMERLERENELLRALLKNYL
jgi:RNA polymerase sigma factor (sigma-70 family)